VQLRQVTGASRKCCGRGSAVRCAVPAALLVLIPKCPLCLAGWLAVATGLGIPAAAAGWLRVLLIALCVAPASVWVLRRMPRQLNFARAFWAARLHGAFVRLR
jgi:hypothetical protein